MAGLTGMSERVGTSVATERHYSVTEVAELWGLSKPLVRRILRKESGLLIVGELGSGRKARRTTVRVPESVLGRIHARMRERVR